MATETETIISPANGQSLLAYFRNLWRHRALAQSFAMRDLKVRYTQSLLGPLWAIGQPLLGVLLFTFVFDRLIHLQTGVPYPVFVLPGLMLWYLFMYLINNGSNSLVDAQDLIRKIYFPRLLLPVARALMALADLGVNLLLLIAVLVIFRHAVDVRVLLLPLFAAVALLCGFTVAVLVSALTVRHRDLHHVVPYLMNFLIWVTPVFFPGTLIPENYRWLLYLNPMAGAVEGARYSLGVNDTFSWKYLPVFVVVPLVFWLACRQFVKTEDYLADEL